MVLVFASVDEGCKLRLEFCDISAGKWCVVCFVV